MTNYISPTKPTTLGQLVITVSDDSTTSPITLNFPIIDEVIFPDNTKNKFQVDVTYSRRAQLTILNMMEFGKLACKLILKTKILTLHTVSTIENIQIHPDYKSLTIFFASH